MNNEKFRILIIGNKERFIHLNDFLHELNKKNVSSPEELMKIMRDTIVRH